MWRGFWSGMDALYTLFSSAAGSSHTNFPNNTANFQQTLALKTHRINLDKRTDVPIVDTNCPSAADLEPLVFIETCARTHPNTAFQEHKCSKLEAFLQIFEIKVKNAIISCSKLLRFSWHWFGCSGIKFLEKTMKSGNTFNVHWYSRLLISVFVCTVTSNEIILDA